MHDAIIWSVFMFLILVGTVAICYVIMLKLLIPKCNEEYYVIIPCNDKSRNVRKKAYGMRIKLNILCDDMNGNVLVLDHGISENEKEQLLEICNEYNKIYYVKDGYIKDYFDGRI